MKYKDLQKLNKQERERKLKELRMELVKSQKDKQGSKTKQIKKIIARIHTLNTSEIKSGETKK